MANEISNKINSILEGTREECETVEILNNYISHLEWSDQLALHGELSLAALKRVYGIIDKIMISPDAVEHLVWLYHKRICDEVGIVVPDDVLDNIIDDFKKYNFIALESLIIQLLKADRLNETQVERIGEYFYDTAVTKQIVSFHTKQDIHTGILLKKSQVQDLINFELFDIIEYAIQEGAVEQEVYTLFKSPDVGEKHRKIKMRLYNRAQELLKGQ